MTAKSEPTCTDAKNVTITVASGLSTGSLGNRLRARKATSDVSLTWTLGVVSPDRYNVHKAALKTDIDPTKTPFPAPLLNTVAVTLGSYTDTGAVPANPKLAFYAVYGRDCGGASVVQ